MISYDQMIAIDYDQIITFSEGTKNITNDIPINAERVTA